MGILKGLLIAFVVAVSAPFAQACCDRMETDFHKNAEYLKKIDPENTLVVLGEVQDVRKVFPFSRPMEMDVKVISVISGQWERSFLTAKQGFRSSNAYFENYVPGKRYLMVFSLEKDFEDGSTYFAQSNCGKSSLPVE